MNHMAISKVVNRPHLQQLVVGLQVFPGDDAELAEGVANRSGIIFNAVQFLEGQLLATGRKGIGVQSHHPVHSSQASPPMSALQ